MKLSSLRRAIITFFVIVSSVFILLNASQSFAGNNKKETAQWHFENIPTKDAEMLRKKINQIIHRTEGKVGVGVYNLTTNQAFYINGQQRFPMASTYKVPIAVHILQLVQQGELKFNQMIAFNQPDLVPGGSGVLSEQLFRPGLSVSIWNLLEVMIRLSDNTATDKLLEIAGGPAAITKSVRKLGIKNMNIDRPTLLLLADGFGVRKQLDKLPMHKRNITKVIAILDSPSPEIKKQAKHRYDNDGLDTATPKAMITLLKLIATDKALQPEYTALLQDIMSRTETGSNRLKGLVPKDVMVAHKTGTFQDTAKDVGYLISKDKNKIAIAVFINANRKGEANSAQAIARIARTAYEYFNPQM